MGLGGFTRFVDQQVQQQERSGVSSFFDRLTLDQLGSQPIIVDLDNIVFKLGNGSLKAPWRAPSDAAVFQLLFKQDTDYTKTQLKRLCKQLHNRRRTVIFVSR